MATGLEDDDEAGSGEAKWHQDDNIELDELCAGYRELEYRKKQLEIDAKSIGELLEQRAALIQARMGQHKAVRTSAGYTVEWKPFKRKGYTVAATEGERWQLRSPF